MVKVLRVACIALLLIALGQTAFAAGKAVVPPCAPQGPDEPTPANRHVVAEGGYPPLSVVLNEEGTTIVTFVIKEDGATKDPAVKKSSGSLRLDEAALNTVNAWLYQPPHLDGKITECTWTAAVAWKLHDEGSEGMGLYVTMERKDFPPGALAKGEAGTTYLIVMLPLGAKEPKAVVTHGSGFEDLDNAATALAVAKSRLTLGQYEGKSAGIYMPLAIIWPAADAVAR